MLRLLSLSLLFLLALGTAGCDSQDDSLLGEFVGRVSVDDQARAVEGEAVYTIVEGPEGPEFVLGLFVGDLYDSDYDEYDYVLFRRAGDRPGVGAYAVDGDPEQAVSATIARILVTNGALSAEGELLFGTDGTLAFTRVDPHGFISGSFQFEARGVDAAPPNRSVDGSARGTFEARYEPPSTFRHLGVNLGL